MHSSSLHHIGVRLAQRTGRLDGPISIRKTQITTNSEKPFKLGKCCGSYTLNSFYLIHIGVAIKAGSIASGLFLATVYGLQPGSDRYNR